MISNLSTAATSFLAPLLSLASLILALLAFLAPVVVLHSNVALVTVSPSSALFNTTPSAQGSIDGPTIRLGVLGSCSQPHNSAPINCSVPSLSPIYDVSVLPSNVPDVLTSPTTATPGFILFSLVLAVLFFILFTLTMLRERLGKLANVLNKPFFGRFTAWLGVLMFMIGLTSYLVLRMWFGKMVDDFNQNIIGQGSGGPQLIASTGTGFTLIWVSYSFSAVPVVCALMKLQLTAGGK
ncbi:hypothetical protein SISNIDRAFT_454939 [Sistotremastrum niveocremeum HHB9708]|uniref:Uncharacterized protein n=1 Tax=Sistotremastrum niveocremeum HHB9708 TaxID=1314777 RepID=A0A164U7N0_9AGAM|nr:hypothetical protein SISNIDRAFT_454939 [Sistotremastrum niveocremeum HHB9708]